MGVPKRDETAIYVIYVRCLDLLISGAKGT